MFIYSIDAQYLQVALYSASENNQSNNNSKAPDLKAPLDYPEAPAFLTPQGYPEAPAFVAPQSYPEAPAFKVPQGYPEAPAFVAPQGYPEAPAFKLDSPITSTELSTHPQIML